MRLAAAQPIDRPRARPLLGPVVDDSLHDVGTTFADAAAVVAAAMTADGRDAITAAASTSYSLDELRLLPPVPQPRRILCVGVNYAEHAEESASVTAPTSHPMIFTRFPSSLVGHGEPLECPFPDAPFDYEGEVAAVIGTATRRVSVDEAMASVAGYSCFMDGSVRDYQRHTSQFTPGKNFDRSGAWGPWIVTADEIGDAALTLTTTVDGVVRQQASTEQLIHSMAAIIAYCSSFTTLEPGDVIATGTPGGVGIARTPPVLLGPGSTVSVDVTGIGTLTNPVA